ncbi:putative dehydrogenase [Microbacterium halimionae]|uniref:Putative dehydrogenase n=1 Tax=Microbacterium halimionae TaxID=1526413 RepID=A0A7W3JQS1_9MICO|nr:Gfo/Idh/MocA family oxidoreductase [Microbacterium halimionae]MBA8817238.1 putative dehydrogenase [Microbacterium halimionae]NII94688.1 putative dehydrogenase [Microbacterium halimionae]
MSVNGHTLRAAIIGTGGIAHAHADALASLAPRVELVAVTDVDATRAREFAATCGGAAIYDDAGDMLAREKLDIVHICTPPQTHAALAEQVARTGVVALVEKPTALSLAEMDRLVAVEAETGVPILTVFQHRFGAAALELRQLVKSGALGRPLVATCETLWYRADDYFDVPWRGRWAIEGGGPTMGHGIHQFDLMLAILGPWARVSAIAARQARPTDTEDVSLALAEFENGAVATVVNSVVSARETSRLRFDFEWATVEVEHLYGYRDADWRFTAVPGREDLAALWRREPSDELSSHRGQIGAIIDALVSGETPAVGTVEARRTLEFAAATYASAFRGIPVEAGQLSGDDPFVSRMDGGMVPWTPVKEVLV